MKSLFNKIAFTVFLYSLLFVTPLSAQNPPQFPEIFPVIYKAIEFFFGFVAVVCAAMVVYGAYMWMFSGGDPQKVKMAQGTLTWAVIGLIFFMMAYIFFDFILQLFGIELPDPGGTPYSLLLSTAIL